MDYLQTEMKIMKEIIIFSFFVFCVFVFLNNGQGEEGEGERFVMMATVTWFIMIISLQRPGQEIYIIVITASIGILLLLLLLLFLLNFFIK